MSGLLEGVVMLSLFAVIVLAAYRLTRELRERGHGAKLDALHDATVSRQARILRVVGSALYRNRRGPAHPPPPWPDQSDNSTKKE